MPLGFCRRRGNLVLFCGRIEPSDADDGYASSVRPDIGVETKVAAGGEHDHFPCCLYYLASCLIVAVFYDAATRR